MRHPIRWLRLTVAGGLFIFASRLTALSYRIGGKEFAIAASDAIIGVMLEKIPVVQLFPLLPEGKPPPHSVH